MFDVVSANNKIAKYLPLGILVLSFVASAQASNITSAMNSLCATAQMFLSVGAMLLVVLAAAVYAIGQILGAETRARASVWATAMITGALIGIVIYLIVPALLNMMMPNVGGVVCGGTGTGPATS